MCEESQWLMQERMLYEVLPSQRRSWGWECGTSAGSARGRTNTPACFSPSPQLLEPGWLLLSGTPLESRGVRLRPPQREQVRAVHLRCRWTLLTGCGCTLLQAARGPGHRQAMVLTAQAHPRQVLRAPAESSGRQVSTGDTHDHQEAPGFLSLPRTFQGAQEGMWEHGALGALAGAGKLRNGQTVGTHSRLCQSPHDLWQGADLLSDQFTCTRGMKISTSQGRAGVWMKCRELCKVVDR